SVQTFQGQIELDSVAAVIPETMTAELAPAPVGVTYTDIKTGGTKATTLESVLVTAGPSTISAVNTPLGEYTLSAGADQLVVDDSLYATPSPSVGATFDWVAGVLAFRQMASKLEPRGPGDLANGPPTLVGFGPPLSYVRAGTTGGFTIPMGSELTVSL